MRDRGAGVGYKREDVLQGVEETFGLKSSRIVGSKPDGMLTCAPAILGAVEHDRVDRAPLAIAGVRQESRQVLVFAVELLQDWKGGSRHRYLGVGRPGVKIEF